MFNFSKKTHSINIKKNSKTRFGTCDGCPSGIRPTDVRHKMAWLCHMGASAQTGHYVCHILKDGRWVIFNDRKVALSQKPPRDLAYMYIFESV